VFLLRESCGDTLRTDGQPGEGGTVRYMSETLAVSQSAGQEPGFRVHLAEFEGPFDLLLQLISQQRLDVTAVALHAVTDEFLAYVRTAGIEWDLDEATSFLVVAATLLDLKAARLLPGGQVEDDEDLALLEARDLLFARLLQYRAFKEVAGVFASMMEQAPLRIPRSVGLDPAYASVMPEVFLGLGADQFARLAEFALAPKPQETVGLGHLHLAKVSVREQAAILVERLRAHGPATFRDLVADCDSLAYVIGRFLALLELYRDGVVLFEQESALGRLRVTYVEGAVAHDSEIEEYDEEIEDADEWTRDQGQ